MSWNIGSSGDSAFWILIWVLINIHGILDFTYFAMKYFEGKILQEGFGKVLRWMEIPQILWIQIGWQQSVFVVDQEELDVNILISPGTRPTYFILQVYRYLNWKFRNQDFEFKIFSIEKSIRNFMISLATSSIVNIVRPFRFDTVWLIRFES